MKKVYRDETSTRLVTEEKPLILKEGYTLLKMEVAGVCRTDIYASQGKCGIPNITLGHEVAATVIISPQYEPGLWVTVDPYAVEETVGLLQDGVYSEYFQVPHECVVPAQGVMDRYGDPRYIAMIEPLSAYLSPLLMEPETMFWHAKSKIGVWGEGRIARTTVDLLNTIGIKAEPVEDGAQDLYDFVIETGVTEENLPLIVDAVKPEGTVIFKSRNPQMIGVNFYQLIKKNMKAQFLHNLNFEQVIELMCNHEFDLKKYFGPTYPLDNFKRAFELDQESESAKIFLSPGTR